MYEKKDIVDRVCGKSGLYKYQTEMFMECLEETIKEMALEGESIHWPRFFDLIIYEKEKKGRDFETGEYRSFGMGKDIKWKTAKKFHEDVKKLV